MLLYQGALAFELFNNLAAPINAMRAALMSALGRSSSNQSPAVTISGTGV
jgi:hypothetical protein